MFAYELFFIGFMQLDQLR